MWGKFFVSLINSQFFFGLMISYTAVKNDIGIQFSLASTFFGVIEMMSMLSRCLGTLYFILRPVRNVSNVYFYFTVLQLVSFLIMGLAHFIKDISILLLVIGMITLGIGRSCHSFPMLIADRNLDSRANPTLFNVWNGLSLFGDAYSLGLTLLALYVFRWNWSFSLGFYGFIFLLTGIIAHLYLEEVKLEQSPVNQEEDNRISEIKIYYRKKKSNILLLADFLCLISLMFVLMFWLPYYFGTLGFSSNSIVIALSMPFGIFLGLISFFPLIDCFPHYKPIITSVLLLLNLITVICSLFVSIDSQSTGTYLFLFTLSNYFMNVPLILSYSSQFFQTAQNLKEKFIIGNFMKLGMEIVTGLMMILTGGLMQINNRYFLYAVILVSAIALSVHVYRRVVQNRQRNQLESSDSF